MFTKKKNHFLYLFEELLKYKVSIAAGLFIFIVFAGGYYFYTSYKQGVEQEAHAKFVECMQFFNASVGEDTTKDPYLDDVESFKTESDKWTQVEKIFKEGYEKHSNSGIAAMFLAFQAEALINLGNLNEGIVVLRKALSAMSHSPVKSLYELKLSLMLISGGSTSDGKEEGLNTLKRLAGDDSSYVTDAALYRLGEYYWHQKDFAAARNYWNQLNLKYGKQTKHPSEWSRLALTKLKLIESK